MLLTAAVGTIGAALTGVLLARARAWSVTDRTRGAHERPSRLPTAIAEPLAAALADAGLDWPPGVAVQVTLLGSLALAVAGAGASPVAGALLGVIAVASAPLLLRGIARRRHRMGERALPEAVEAVAAELRGGATVRLALRSLADRPGPLRPELGRLVARLDLGADLEPALRAWARARRSAAVRSAVGAFAIAAEAGGPAADALDGLASSLRDQLAVHAEVHAQSAQARLSAVVVGVAPAGYLVLVASTDPATVGVLFGTAAGRVCLVAAVVLEGLAVVWMRHLLGRAALR